MSILKDDWSGQWYNKVWRMVTWMVVLFSSSFCNSSRKNFCCLQMLSILLFFSLMESMEFILYSLPSRYVSVLHRILGLRLIYRTTNMQRQLSFEFMNRQLVWHEFTVFCVVHHFYEELGVPNVFIALSECWKDKEYIFPLLFLTATCESASASLPYLHEGSNWHSIQINTMWARVLLLLY